MKRLIIRHALTDGNRTDRALYGKTGAPVNAKGFEQIQLLTEILKSRGIDFDNEAIVVSGLQRTQQTAKKAGFKHVIVNPLFNEVNTADPAHTNELVAQNMLPDEAMMAAQNILHNPPAQKIIVTHGLVIAALAVELGQTYSSFIPDFCEIWDMEF